VFEKFLIRSLISLPCTRSTRSTRQRGEYFA